MSPKLRLVKNHHRTKEIGALHLSRRAVNALSHLQIRTIGHLIDHSRKGIHGLRNIGRLTQFEITEGLDALAQAVHDDGSVSWITYAVRQRFKILPSKERRRWEVRPFLEDLPMTLEAAVRIKYGEKAALLFRQHTTQASASAARLVDVASSWGCTKQRASFLEKTIIAMLRRVIWEDNYRGCSFRFREEYLRPLRALRTALQSRGSHQIAEADWNGLLHTTWHIDRSDVRFIEGLLLRLTESKLFKGRGANALPLTLPQSAKSGICDRAVRTIIGALSADYPAGLGKRDLSRVLKRRFGVQALKLPDLSTLLNAAPEIEHFPDRDCFRLSLGFLKRNTDRCERLLSEIGKPMHFRELVSRLVVASKTNLRLSGLPEQLSRDRRFKSVGRSGWWGLANWKFETRAAVTIAAEVLRHSSRPMHESELFELISARRPTRRKSLSSQLSADSRFRRIGPARWITTKTAET